MKEKYTTPEMEIIKFDTEDVITTSGGFTDGGNYGDFGGNSEIQIP